MSNTNLGNTLLKTADQELSFRRRIVDLIGGLLRSEAPFHFKAFVVIILFIGLSASFQFAVFVLEVFLVLIKGQQHEAHVTAFAGILAGHGLAGVLTGIPLTMRMGDLEEAHRLNGMLDRVQATKDAKRKADGTD